MHGVDGIFREQPPTTEDIPQETTREAAILEALLRDFGNQFAALILSVRGGGRPPEDLRMTTFLESYGHVGDNSWFLANVGGPLTEEDIKNHPCRSLILNINRRVSRINRHLEDNCPEKAHDKARELQDFLAASARTHSTRHSF